MTDDSFIEQLRAKEQIREAMARYARGIDRRDEKLVRSVYHEDSVDEHGFGLARGGWDIAALVRRDGNGFPDDWKATTHFLGQHTIEVHGDQATSEFYYFSYTRTADPDGVDWDMMDSGRYVDRWERRDGQFRVSHRVVIHDWVRTDRVSTPWPGPDHDVPKMCWGAGRLSADPATTTFGASGPQDASYALLDLTAQ
jgi:hypothetical protein